jgi:hypothetical protein
MSPVVRRGGIIIEDNLNIVNLIVSKLKWSMILSKHICVFKLAEDKSSLMYMIIEIYILLLLAVDYNIFPLLIAGRRRICFSYKQNIKNILKLLIPVINNH